MITKQRFEQLKKLEFDHGGINVYYYDDKEMEILAKRKQMKELQETIQELNREDYFTKLVLECSTKGDKRFSAFNCYIKLFGVEDVIEFHYQLSKRNEKVPEPDLFGDWAHKFNYLKTMRGKSVDYIEIGGKKFDAELLPQFYHLLWAKFLDNNKELVKYLQIFDDYNDIFKGRSRSCQSDSIRTYIKEGREILLTHCKDLAIALQNTFKRNTQKLKQ